MMKSKYIKPCVEVLSLAAPLSVLTNISLLDVGVDDYADLPDATVDAE